MIESSDSTNLGTGHLPLYGVKWLLTTYTNSQTVLRLGGAF